MADGLKGTNGKHEEPNDPMINRRFSHYQVSKKIGSGGMGIVYESEDLALCFAARRQQKRVFRNPFAVGTGRKLTSPIHRAARIEYHHLTGRLLCYNSSEDFNEQF
jgi:hypothetical protein